MAKVLNKTKDKVSAIINLLSIQKDLDLKGIKLDVGSDLANVLKDEEANKSIDEQIELFVDLMKKQNLNTYADRVFFIANALVEKKVDGLFQSVLNNFFKAEGFSKDEIEKAIKDSTVIALKDYNFENSTKVEDLLIKSINPFYKLYVAPKPSTSLPDDLFFELSDLHDKVYVKIEKNDDLRSVTGYEYLIEAGVISADYLQNLNINQLLPGGKKQHTLNSTFPKLKSGKPDYSRLTPQEMVYASIIDGDLNKLQSICYDKNLIKSINLSFDENLASRFAAKHSVLNVVNKIEDFVRDFQTTEFYKENSFDENRKNLNVPPKKVIKFGVGVLPLNKKDEPYDPREVQPIWDEMLLDGYKRNPQKDVYSLYEEFLDKIDVSYEKTIKKDFSNSFFKRVPVFAKKGQFTVKDFVDNYLPKTKVEFLVKASSSEILEAVSNTGEVGKRIVNSVDTAWGFTYTEKELQRIWDEKLIDSFKDEKTKTGDHVRSFLLEAGIKYIDMLNCGIKVKRMPLPWNENQKNLRTGLFLSKYMPTIANILYKYEDELKEKKEYLLDIFSVSKEDVSAYLSDGVLKEEFKEFRETSEDFNSTIVKKEAFKDFKRSSNSNWKKVK